MTRKFKVLNSSGLAFGVNFDGQILDLAHENAWGIKDYYCLIQPDFDANGTPCLGTVCMSGENIEEITC
ncbi:MAG: hypothetical protein FMNOHCHN_03497 [Ignavibacteriaceae bacterium]|nr:hypothetical protein [Ignavibacteriaceae bacterium]